MKYVFTAIVVLLLVFTACQGGQQTAEQQNNPQTQQNENQAQAQAGEQVQQKSTTQTEQTSEKTSTTSKGLDELQSFLVKKPTLTYMVDYDVVTTASGETQSSKMTYYIKSTEKMRIDIMAQGMEIRSYILGQTYNSCNKATGNWMCLESQMQKSSSDDVQKDIEQNVAKYKVTKLAGKTIAGASTECFRVEAEQGNVDYCFTANAVPLYIKTWGTASGNAFSSEMTATKYSTTVADDAFTLPAQPQAMPTGGLPPSVDLSQYT